MIAHTSCIKITIFYIAVLVRHIKIHNVTHMHMTRIGN